MIKETLGRSVLATLVVVFAGCSSASTPSSGSSQQSLNGGAGSSSNGAGSASASATSQPPPGCDPGGQPQCTGDAIGDPQACLDDGTLKAKIAAICSSQNLDIVAIGFDDACGPGLSHFAKYECCTTAPPPPPPPQCTGDAIGDPQACLDDQVLGAKIGGICQSQGLEVTAVGFDDACGPGVSHFAKYECCPAQPPPPPPPNNK